MSKEELPEPWRSALEPKGISSRRGLSTETGLGPNTAVRLVNGEGTSAATINTVADKLFNGDRNFVWGLYGATVRDHGRWDLPEEASLLTEDQREAVRAVVRAMLPPEVKRGNPGVKRTKPTIDKPGKAPDNVYELDHVAARDVGKPPGDPRGETD